MTPARVLGRFKTNEVGFTLVELLVVVLVVGVLAAIAIPVYLGVQAKAKDSGALSDLANLRAAVFVLQTANGTMPAAIAATDTSFSSSWKSAGATRGPNTVNLVYKPGSGTSFCVADVSSTGAVFTGSDVQGITLSTLSTATAACP